MSKHLKYNFFILPPSYQLSSDDWMRENGFTDDYTEKIEEEKRLQWHGATIKDLGLPLAVTITQDVLHFFDEDPVSDLNRPLARKL